MAQTHEQTVAQVRKLLVYLRRAQREYWYFGLDISQFIAAQEKRLEILTKEKPHEG